MAIVFRLGAVVAMAYQLPIRLLLVVCSEIHSTQSSQTCKTGLMTQSHTQTPKAVLMGLCAVPFADVHTGPGRETVVTNRVPGTFWSMAISQAAQGDTNQLVVI